MNCRVCRAEVDADSRFCTACGAPVEAAAPVPSYPTASAPASDGAPVSTVPPAARIEPYGAPYDAPRVVPGAAGPGNYPPAMPAAAPTQTPVPGKTGASVRSKPSVPLVVIGAVAGAAIIVMALLGAFTVVTGHLPWQQATRQGTTQQRTTDDSSDTSDTSDTSGKDGDATETDTDAAPAVCDDDPDLETVAVSRNDDTLVATVRISAPSTCKANATVTVDEPGARVTIKDEDGNVVADAIFDFSDDDAVEATEDGADVKLAYSNTQYYRAIDLIGDVSDLDTTLETGQPIGYESVRQHLVYTAGALIGASPSEDEAEADALAGLGWQVSHDRSRAGTFMTTLTTQLASRRDGMTADGVIWDNRAILAQFIARRVTEPDVLLVWSGDWPTYDKNETKYYVTLSGESFANTDAAWNWCSANGYGKDDCMPIDLQ